MRRRLLPGVIVVLAVGALGCERRVALPVPPVADTTDAFNGAKAGDEREVRGVKLRWCPAGRFTMGSPPSEPERRPGEDQVEVVFRLQFEPERRTDHIGFRVVAVKP